MGAVRSVLLGMGRGFSRHEGVTRAAALAFFFFMSLFPFLIFLASAMALLPIHNLADRTLDVAANFVPDETMPLVESMLNATMRTNKGLLSAGFVIAIIAASNGFNALIAALDRVYEVQETRNFWRVRIMAVWMTFVVGGLVALALSAMLLGPHFGLRLADEFDVSDLFVAVWPFVRWVVALCAVAISFELMYCLAPNRKQPIVRQVPGAVFGMAVWVISSSLLGVYLRDVAYFNATYGMLTALLVLMIWFQLSAVAILLGAELNAQLELRRAAASLIAEPPVPVVNEVAGEQGDARSLPA